MKIPKINFEERDLLLPVRPCFLRCSNGTPDPFNGFESGLIRYITGNSLGVENICWNLYILEENVPLDIWESRRSTENMPIESEIEDVHEVEPLEMFITKEGQFVFLRIVYLSEPNNILLMKVLEHGCGHIMRSQTRKESQTPGLVGAWERP